MTVVRSPKALAPVATALCLLLMTALGTLTACSNSNRGVTGSVGVGDGVALITAGDVTSLYVGQDIAVTASVVNDVNNQGVIWSLIPNNGPSDPYNGPSGSLTQITTTTALFVAPTTTFTGEAAATITATAKVNAQYNSSVTITTSGTAVANVVQLFPANVNVGYAASFTISGGTPPFTWTLATGSGPLPPGILLLGSTSGLDSISGVPTTAGTYSNITLQATDAVGTVSKFAPVTITVNPEDTCIVSGTFALMASGFRGGGGMTHAANITINNVGIISGEQDYKDGHRTTLDEPLTATSNCINRQTNSGQIELESASGTLLYNLSATPPDANGIIQSARIQLIGSGDDTGSGLMARVDPSAITPTPPANNFAFGLIGVEKQEPNGVHYASAGRFTTDATGAMSGGQIDSNNPEAPLSAATLGGALSAPDASGRGTATFTTSAGTTQFAYYIVNATKSYLINIDPQTADSPRSTGFMTTQVGDVAGTSFDANALGTTPSVLSLWGAIRGMEPITAQSLGLLSGANGTTLNATLDISNQETNLAPETYTAQPYVVASNGRGTLTLSDPVLDINYSLVFYMDGINSGYVVALNDTGGSGGLLEAQYPMPAGGFPTSVPGYFVGGTQFAMAPGPITLTPLATLAYDALTSNFTNATFNIDPTTGRGFGTLTQSGVGAQPASLYIVSPTKLDVLRFSTRGVDSNIDWLIQNIE